MPSSSEPNPASAPEPAALDEDSLGDRRAHLGASFGTIRNAYLQELRAYVETLRAACSYREPGRLAATARALQGTSRNLGAECLADLCQRIEEASRRIADRDGGSGPDSDAWPEVARVLDTLIGESDRVRAALIAAGEGTGPRRDPLLPVRGNAQHILVAEADDAARATFRLTLEQDGHLVEEAPDGEGALAICEHAMPDLVLLDASLPGIDGLQACGRIRALPGGDLVPLLLIIAVEGPASIQRVFDAGANDYLARPVHRGLLRQRVGGLLAARRAERSARALTYLDTLTGLSNRTDFLEHLDQLAQHSDPAAKRFAILFLDLDRFKLINDTLGHDVGDLLLEAAGERIRGCVGPDDLVARFGGDEFAVIMRDARGEQVAESVVLALRRALGRPFTFRGQSVHASASVGISLFPDDGRDPVTMMKHADTAMFRAKESGAGYCFYEAGMEAVMTRQMEIENDLHHALARGQFEVRYQPRVDLLTGTVAGAEALIRWRHPELGEVSPADFVPHAEATGLIHEIGSWVLREAACQARAWRDAGHPPMRMSVNVSGRQFENAEFPATVRRVLGEAGLDGESLELEITESAIMQHPEEASRMLAAIRELGVTVALDDFGTGYSSLAYLHRFPLDVVKLDRSFIAAAEAGKPERPLISGIVSLAHGLGLRVVAEGVETADHLELLRGDRCDEVQGYLVACPLEAERFEAEVLRAGRHLLAAG